MTEISSTDDSGPVAVRQFLICLANSINTDKKGLCYPEEYS
jgi:hypothetical protein